MEAQHQQVPHWEWLNREGDGSGDMLEFASMGFPSFLDDFSGTADAADSQDVPVDARPAPGDPQLDIPANEVSDEISSLNPIELEWGSMTVISPPELPALGDSNWSPGSGSSSFNSPSTVLGSPYLSPNFLLGESPLHRVPFSSRPSISPYAVSRESGFPCSVSPPTAWETPRQAPYLLPETASLQGFPYGSPNNMSLYAVSTLTHYDGGLDAAVQPAGAQKRRCRATTTRKSPELHGRPAGISAREWRYLTRPDECPVCSKGHPYRGEVKRHIVSNHPERAAEFQLSTERFECRRCGKSYGRKDRLLRHLTDKHGRTKGRRKRGE